MSAYAGPDESRLLDGGPAGCLRVVSRGESVLLEIDDLKVYFYVREGIVRAVNGVSFALNRGETMGLVGESGCGKSATCLALMRMIAPPGRITGGRVVLDGEDLLRKSAAEMEDIRGCGIALILQDPLTSLNPSMSIGSQVAEAIRIHQKVRGPELRRRVLDILKQVRLPDVERLYGLYPHQLSGGMRQRVVGAIALSCRPAVLIADEPTTSLDATVQAQYLRLLRDLQAEFRFALIFVTHDFGLVAQMCDRVAVMYAGKIVEQAAVRELFDRPAHPYAEALLASIPKIGAHGQRLVTIEGQPPGLWRPIAGCAFRPRCAKALPACETTQPPTVQLSDDHSVDCWLYGQEASGG